MKPTDITARCTERELTVTWDDGHISVYSFFLLRAGCPCAECRGGHDRMGSTPDPEVFSLVQSDSPANELKDLVPVGSYGLTPYWADGHSAGIYRWDYLRALCPCDECRK